MDGFLDFFQLEAFFSQVEALRDDFPRQIKLVEESILGVLGAGVGLFLLIALLRRSAMAAIAASLAGLTFLLEAVAFDRLGLLPEGSEPVLFALFLSAVILFLTASVRAAKENVLIGAVFLVLILGAITLGVLDYLNFQDGFAYLRAGAVLLGVYAVLLTVQQGMSGDRRSLHIAPGVLIAVSSLVVFYLNGQNGLDGWLDLAIPHAMLSGGVLLAMIGGLLPAGAAVGGKDSERAPLATSAQPFVSMSDDDEPQLEGLSEDPLPVEDAPAERPVRMVEETPPPPPSQTASAQSPISALWGHRHEKTLATPVRQETDVSALRAALGAAGYSLWDWKSTGQINASEETASLIGLSKVSQLTPENVRSLIAEADLETYDEEILGGGEPATGQFDFIASLKEGRKLVFRGERQVDEEGFIERVVTFITPQRKAAAPASAGGISAQMIREGLANGEFEAWFQPIVRLATGDIAGFESLVRWRHPSRAHPIMPDDFMPVAIEEGLEMEITGVVLDQAAAELAAWISASPNQGQFVSFNVSATSLINDRLVKLVRSEVRKHNLPYGALVVELTESHVMGDQQKALAVAKALRQAGARIALDDLGAGQSTLNQLSKFRFDVVKTDKALLASAERDEHGHTLLAGLVDMAHRMGTEIVAEGAESAEAAALLRDIKCDYAQGYYFGRPEPAGGSSGEEDEQERSAAVTADLR